MKFENVKVFNFEGAFRGMRNPMDSWMKSDSDWNNNVIGQDDLKLAQKLIRAGSEHAKFMRQIFVSVDITAPRYWWCEFDTYKVGTVANSCSTMHKLKSYPITQDMFALDEIDSFDSNFISHLETLRCLYNKTGDMKYFRKLKQLLPESFIQKRTITMNYSNVANMYHQRKNHRLTEWSIDFINFVKKLPYAHELIIGDVYDE